MAPKTKPHPRYEPQEMSDAVVELFRARTNKDIRTKLRKLATMVGYKEVPGEESKVAAIKDWTAEIDRRFLK